MQKQNNTGVGSYQDSKQMKKAQNKNKQMNYENRHNTKI